MTSYAPTGFKLPQARTTLPPYARCPSAHAHNDYEHRRPLQDALDRGFSSVEADVWLVDGELRVAHDLETPYRGARWRACTWSRWPTGCRRTTGRCTGTGATSSCSIDIKSDGPSTYAAIDKELTKYRGISTVFINGRVLKGAVTSVISGNRPLDVLKAQKVRYAGYDGRLSDLQSGMPASLMPLVSDNWTNNFTWTGCRARCRPPSGPSCTTSWCTAHHAGYRVRFWATPDARGAAREALWSELDAAGVDHINTDDLHGLESFLRN